MRTLAVAWAETAEDDCLRAVAASQLHFSGVAAISDPVREDVPDAVRRCLNAGMNHCLIKPFTLHTLYNCLQLF